MNRTVAGSRAGAAPHVRSTGLLAPRVPGWTVRRTLGSWGGGPRWLAVEGASGEPAVLHTFREKVDPDRLRDACAVLSCLDDRHALVPRWVHAGDGPVCVATRYTGAFDGLVTFSSLLAQKGGQMSPIETRVAVEQLLGLSASAQRLGLAHGAVGADAVLVDRSGSSAVELYGLRRALRDEAGADASAHESEVRSLVVLAGECLTGVASEIGPVNPARDLPRRARRWRGWLERGLGEGYPSAEDALASLPRC